MTAQNLAPCSASSTARTWRAHLSASDVSLVIDMTQGRSPAVLHWGAALGPLTAADAETMALASLTHVGVNHVDLPMRTSILPAQSDGWPGRPGIDGARDDGRSFSPLLTVRTVDITRGDGTSQRFLGSSAGAEAAAFTEIGDGSLRVQLEDADAGLEVELTIEMLPTGLVRLRASVRNTGEDAYTLRELAPVLPVPLHACELLDFAGRWGKERTPQRQALTVGTHLREGRKGRTGSDAAHVLHVGAPGFDEAQGEVWAVHTAFSGNHRHWAEKLFNGTQVIGGSELLLPGEGRLQPGEQYTSPWLYANHGIGLDAVAQRFHRHLRARPQHPSTDRPVTLNVWEAVYFDHDLTRLRDLADRAAAIGVERYVLDDGWFGGRRNDRAGLGDWYVSPDVWPHGLGPLVDHVTGLGMQFGLWFEPEMVNEDSDVARAHPEWILGPTPGRLPITSRYQQVLNLTIPEAYAHVRDQMAAILDAYDISYIKWDHNRDLVEAGDRSGAGPRVHEQTLAAYRLMDELTARFPGLEIESCSSGGSRVDLAVLERTDRVWVSDCIDPLERQQMNRWTSQLIPLEMMGSHIASGASHTTGRLHSLSFRAATALFGHLGIEWDLTRASEEDIDELSAWIRLYKEHRGLLFTGDLVRRIFAGGTVQLTGVIAPDRRTGLFQLASLARSEVSPRGRFVLPGLDADRRYRVLPVIIGRPPFGLTAPAWFGIDDTPADAALARIRAPQGPLPGSVPQGAEPRGVVLPGAALMRSGLATPQIGPEQAVVLSVTALD